MLLLRNIPPRYARKSTSVAEIVFTMSLMTKLTLPLTDLTMMKNCCSVSGSWVDKKNHNLSRSWIVFQIGIVAKLLLRQNFPPQNIYPKIKCIKKLHYK